MQMRIKRNRPVLALVIATCIGTSTVSAQGVGTSDESIYTTEKFNTLLDYVSAYYVDSVDAKRLVEQAIIGLFQDLDPHTIYIPKEELEEMNAPLNSNFEGIGIRFQIMDDTIMVVNPIPGGPSEKLGIRAGDKIVMVDGELVAGTGISNTGVRDRLLGDKGTIVKVGIYRKGEKDLLYFTITRDKIPIYSVDAYYMAAPGIGYIKLNNFAAETMNEFRDALHELKEQGMVSLILDLQGNGGGYLSTAIDLADEFLADDELIVYTEGRAFPKKETNATSRGGFESGKLVVLIDESSASASEIVSGAVQDWDRGLIVGRRSFGKGLVQKPLMLPDGSAIRLTTSRYYTPTGRCIQKPYEDGKDAYIMEKYDRMESGELTSLDSIDFPDSLMFETLVNGRTVYGGGGIMPDVFVPLDTTRTSDYYVDLWSKGVFNTFCLEYVDENRTALSEAYPDFAAFNANFNTSDIWEQFLSAAEESEVEFDQDGYDLSADLINLRIKATIAQNIWGTPQFYEVMNQANDIFLKALEVLQDDTFERMKLAYND